MKIGPIEITRKREQSVVPVDKPKQKVVSPDVLGSFLNYSDNKLSNEKTVSSKILSANKGWVYRNNDAIAQEVSKVEFELYTLGIANGEIVYNEILSHPLLDLLDKPNPETTKNDALYIVQSHKKLSGDAFWLKVRDNGKVVALRSLPPDKVELAISPPTPENPVVIDAYVYKDRINGEYVEITYPVEDIIHFKKPNPNNPFRGYGAVEALAETIDLDNLTTETSMAFFRNGAITNFVLTTESRLDPDQIKRLQAELRSTYGGASKAYKTMILGGGLKPEDISFTNKDQEFLGQLEWYRDKIMIGFGNTKASLGMVDDVNRASFEGSNIGWLRTTVRPDIESIVNTLNEFLVPEFGENLILGFKDPVPEDRAEDIAEIKDLYPLGIMTKDEAREIVDMDPVDDETGPEYYNNATPDVSGADRQPNVQPTDNNNENNNDNTQA